MRQTDVVIVGGGLAGSLVAAMLGAKGIAAVLIDPHEIYPPELRCEKLDGGQIATLMKTGMGAAVLARTALATRLDVARRDHVIDRKPGLQRGIMYDDLVNAVRAAIPAPVERVRGKVNTLATGDDRQKVTLSSGEEFSARLVVLANGLNLQLRDSLGMRREMISPAHSVTIGFDIAPAGRQRFPFEALTWYPRRVADRFAYLTLFPVPGAMRANFMVYRDIDDPWLTLMRKSPREALLQAIPKLEDRIGRFDVAGEVRVRPADLYQTVNVEQAGVVLVGDAFATSCPAAGTGTGKVFTDVERLCNRYIPQWLATPGMGAAKVADFYADPEKLACDAHSRALAFSLRSTSIDPGAYWAARRLGKYALRVILGNLRRITARPHPIADGETAAQTLP